MIEEALLLSLIVAIGFFSYEFFRMKFVFQDAFRYNHFFSGYGLNNIKINDATDRIENETKIEMSYMKNRFIGIEDRVTKQENIIEKLIREISELNG